MNDQTEFLTRELFNARCAHNEVEKAVEMMPSTMHFDSRQEATIDQNIQTKKRKPTYDYKIPSEATDQGAEQSASQRISLRKLKPSTEVTADPNATHQYELPENGLAKSGLLHSTLKQHRKMANPDTYDADYIPRDYKSQNLGVHFDSYGADDDSKFTRSKLLEARRYEQKLEEDRLKDKFIETKKAQYQDYSVPFWQLDAGLHYNEPLEVPTDSSRQNMNTTSWRQMELSKSRKIDNKDLEKPTADYVSLSKQRKIRLESQVNQPKVAEIAQSAYDEQLKTLKPKRTHFATAVLKQKNPDWQLLRVKSTMTGDEDKPLYSSFAPDGFYRELLMPQIRAPSHGCRQVPQQLRGMVRVMQLPIVGEVSQLLDTESDRLPGDTRILTRPSIFE